MTHGSKDENRNRVVGGLMESECCILSSICDLFFDIWSFMFFCRSGQVNCMGLTCINTSPIDNEIAGFLPMIASLVFMHPEKDKCVVQHTYPYVHRMEIDQVSDVVAAKLARFEVEKKCFGSAGDPFAAPMLVPEESWQEQKSKTPGAV